MVVSLIWLRAVLIAYSLMAAMLWSLLWWFRRSGAGRRSPLARNLLREPGDSLRAELEDVGADLVGICCLLLTTPLIVYSSSITQMISARRGTVRRVLLAWQALASLSWVLRWCGC